MKVAFDTSTLVASLTAGHPHHDVCWPWLQAVVKGRHEASVCAHALAELYATLSAMPTRPMPTPAEVRLLIRESVLPHFRVVPLAAGDYLKALDLVAARVLRSGAVYDALIEVGARKSGVKHLLTVNASDFERLCDDAATWLIDPRKRPPA